MTAVVGRVWGWVSPASLYSSWGSKTKPEKPPTTEIQTKSRWGLWGLTAWVWRGEDPKKDQKTIAEEFWETEETFKPLEVEELGADVEIEKAAARSSSRWWSRMLPSRYFFWPWWSLSTPLHQQKCAGWSEGTWDSDEVDGESDYGTPPPSPTPQTSAFQFFSRSWTGEIVPEHYDICFNFLRHLFDLFVVGFLTTVSPPTKFILDVLGVQGALKLWLHGMVMFLVSSVGMAGLLWVVQEYLLLFALIFGIVQALVISVSVRPSEASAEGDDGKADGEVKESEEEQSDIWEQNEPQQTAEDSKKGVKQKS
uniref:Si:ch73-25f10.6 n=1 Tax=Cyprinus carpio carpio TaxID=630221 RepID=A0A8C1ESK7_CYPCA